MQELRWRREGESQEEMTEYKNSDMQAAIDEYIHNERNREILKRRLCDGICYEPLAEEFNMSVSQVKQIVYRSQDRLFKHLENLSR